ncbi:MAG: primosomal protein N' [Proteobacteria bacterium]|nr:primosomal protein N' [Pseudomonadota bacterium]MBU1740200.1 primosomal protein N' [Pseudomonadota bacterium]
MRPRASLAEVALPLPVDGTFTYRVPSELARLVRVGVRVLAPVGRRRVVGLVLDLPEQSPVEELRDVLDVLDDEPLFGPELSRLLVFAARYYQAPIGLAAAGAVPGGLVKTARQGAPALDPPRIKRRPGWRLKAKPDLERRLGRLDRSLSDKQRLIIDRLSDSGQVVLNDLAAVIAQPLGVARRLEAMGLADLEPMETLVDPLGKPLTDVTPAVRLTGDQDRALEAIKSRLVAGQYAPFLLYGATGSGKTEVYLRAVEAALQMGRPALVLVPEIGLTVHLEGLFAARFGANVVTLHSGLTDRGRLAAWRAAAGGRVKVVLGARSAVFAPLEKPAVIVVDEEHEEAYKQEDRLRYQARDLALYRGRLAGAVVILGSATPAVTTWHLAEQDRIRVLTLPKRIHDRPLPTVEIVDKTGFESNRVFSPQLEKALADTLAAKKQSILFLGRRGYAPVVFCRDCGRPVTCPNCTVSLTLHQARQALLCHYCGLSASPRAPCPLCGSTNLRPWGLGTERLEQDVIDRFPSARTIRLDSDTTRRRGALRRILTKIADHEADVIVGTQIITKGHHFPDITLVGVVDADLSLCFPDYRAAERTFALLHQVGGRAGRGKEPGRVIVQTGLPDHYVFEKLAAGDWPGFVAQEMEFRRALFYPPFSRLTSVLLSGNAAARVRTGIEKIRRVLDECLQQEPPAGRIEVLGPAPAPLTRLVGKTRWHLAIKAERISDAARLAREARTLHRTDKFFKGLGLAVDVDPASVL